MQDVVVFGEGLSRFGVEEVCALSCRVDTGQTASYRNRDFSLFIDFLETRSVVRNVIQLLASREILECAGVSLAVLAG